MGPTAVGKTSLAIWLAQSLPFDIISVDSAMVYRGMDIGTAKPTPEQLREAPHHLINICDPKESYSVGQFRRDALLKIEEIFTRKRLPLLVGGTMLYFRLLQQGLSNLPRSSGEVRAKIRQEKESLGLEALYLRLQKIDPKAAMKLSSTDSQRIQRALEVYDLTGKSLTELQLASPPDPLPYDFVNIVVAPQDMDFLRCNIKKRFQEMLTLGFIDEVRQLYQRGDLHFDLPSIRTVGYRQAWQYLEGQIGYDKFLELVPIATRQLAKRQLTWLRSWDNSKWFDCSSWLFKPNVMNFINSNMWHNYAE